jgi:adenosylcobyric acid synthase
LNYLHNCGYVREILTHHRNGGLVVGICGGYQMLGKHIADPYHIETSIENINGIGLLPVRTLIEKEKVTCQVSAKIHPSNRIFKNTDELKGYEIHMGRTELQDEKYMFEIIQREEKQTSTPDGFMSADGRVWGTYIHGIFDNDSFRHEFIKHVKEAKDVSVSSDAHAPFSFQKFRETQYDALAELVRRNIDMKAFYGIAGLR